MKLRKTHWKIAADEFSVMAESPFALQNLGATQACYVRKLSRRRHWGEERDANSRVTHIIENVFRDAAAEGSSVYFATSEEDVRRIALAINATRDSPVEDVVVIAIKPDELGDVEVSPAPGGTPCQWANQLHRDLHVSDVQQLAPCITRMLKDERQTRKFNKSRMKRALELAREEHCDVIDQSTPCDCTSQSVPTEEAVLKRAEEP